MFDPWEEGACGLCGQDRDLDGGLCEVCHELRLDGFEDIDIAAGAWWFAADYHGGMMSPLYAALCRNPYSPGPLESGPDDESGQHCYDEHLLASGLISYAETHPNEGLSRHC